jgi:3'(2'), 5'-bisphosphate nucleotidase
MIIEEKQLLFDAVKAAILGGNEILDVYGQEFDVEFKDDKSPLTLADRRAHTSICYALASNGLPVLSEEGKNIPFEIRKDWKAFWMVDPLDGTKEFIKRNGEFTVNIALIRDGVPVIGVILVPVTGLLYFASVSAGAFKIAIDDFLFKEINDLISSSTSIPDRDYNRKFTVVASRSHMSAETQSFIEKLRISEPGLECVSIGSSLKLCLIAEGKADIYPRFGPTMEWDTAAGQAILEIAGGKMIIAQSGVRMQYNKPDLLNPWFIASMPR